jgi:membrane fusion protein, multidrug efflux system
MAKLKKWSIGLITVALLGVGGGAFFFSKQQASAKSDSAGGKPQAKPMEFIASELEKPRAMQLPLVIDFTGPLTAPKTATVRAKAGATLLNLDVAEGARVKAGQRIGQLDLASLQAGVADRGAAHEAAKSNFANAERQYNANKNLAEQNFISPTALESQRTQVEAARAQMLSAQASLTTARLTLRDASLVAPIDGIVSKRHVVPGEKVAFDQNIVSIVDLRRLELAGTVPTHEVHQLKPGMPVSLHAEGIGQPVEGRIERIAPAAETGTRSIGVYVVIDNPKETLRAGQYATAKVNVSDATPRLTVPATAIVSLSGEEYVWTLEKDTLARRIVTTGRKDPLNGRVEVLSGLPPDAQVLAAKFDNLKDGAPAKIVASKAPPPAAAGAPASTAKN